ncbi:hypothetical protein RvY_08711-2 [Ramazzottius varieornatus]|uniref:ABC transporter domain-containing protein n=1 Tax=Ramazzottius varieornatus TaxID=947166 RepID=A0A1D1V6X5_RAMVA|nr:hypothetical protein RvY_08711-2 [Ramazzottius varieornatus]
MISAASAAGHGVALARLATAESTLELDTIHRHHGHNGDAAVAAGVASQPGTSGPARVAWFRTISPELKKRLGDTTSVSLSWKDLVVRVVPEKKRLAAILQPSRRESNATAASLVAEPRKILNGVSGVVQSGECMALMGASGAGKTTLINMLTGRKREMKLQMEGTICVNGHQIGSAVTILLATYSRWIWLSPH